MAFVSYAVGGAYILAGAAASSALPSMSGSANLLTAIVGLAMRAGGMRCVGVIRSRRFNLDG